ncbi:oligosaccharide flippase family protein [Acetobacter conturbans]|uniref:Oligosaccharide flippase family protein n=1 Tax=Acetobacter conturbans TaxID=1737472 RepID=A0ABX0K0U8_9PROT|nr:oligosaccharide flippase family protein [Acetobacter conturbans]NHN89356.1 oligosaccharide flippase family protein [Acetobacter conturbans]
MEMSDAPGLPQAHHILSNTAWNIIGRISPVFVALLVTPKLIHMLGLSRWGIFTIALSLVGTLGIFDMGLGRAMTRAIADRPDGKTTPETADLIFTGSVVLTLMGVVGAVVAAAGVGLWVDHGLKIPPALHSEVLWALWIFCATGPFLMLNAAYWSVYTSYHAFRTANLINIPISIAYYIVPVLALYVWDSLIAVMLVVMACRIVLTIAYFPPLMRLVPELWQARFRPALLKPLLRVGGWMTVSNVAFPILNYLDRFMIASVVSAAATSYYSTPADVVNRFNMLTTSVSGSSFPALSSSWRRDPQRTAEIYSTSVLVVCALLFPPCLVAGLFSHPLLALWIDPGFADQSSTIMKFLCVGVFLGGVDTIASGLVDAIGRADANAKFSICEIFFYLPLLYLSLIFFGVPGAACAWAIRICADYGLRSVISVRLYKPLRPAVLRVLPATLVGGAILSVAMLPMSMPLAWGALFVLSGVFYGVIWFACLNHGERNAFISVVRRVKARLRR